MNDSCDIAIVGAGAAGLATAIFAAQANPSRRILLIDSARSVGAKILVAGGGRCNVTHKFVTPRDYNGPQNIIRNVLAAFDAARAVQWFESLGVKLKEEETGKLFPVTDSARTVLNALLRRCEDLGVRLVSSTRITDITRDSNRFQLQHGDGVIECTRLVLATGGRSLPRTGSDGSGWQLIQRLGHTVTPTYPALVPLVLSGSFFHGSLSGISQEVELSTFADGKLIDRRAGSLLWTHFGISGPVVLDASRHWVIAHADARNPQLRASLLPGEDFQAVESRLMAAAQKRPRTTLLNFLAQMLPARVADAILSHLAIVPSTTMAQLARDARRSLVQALTALPLPVERDRGWNYAEVTAGGVPLSEIDYRTMASRIVPNLTLVGEMLDCDGRIGGFNFQWAWATGHLAGSNLH